VGEVGSPHLGLCLDAYHWYTGPSKTEDLNYLTADNLFHVQFSDIADVPRELASDSQRIVAGDGDIPLANIVERLHAIDYRGAVSLEILNPQIWPIPPLQFGEIGMTAMRKVLGQASA
jgi:sugar phosphate isomerase/epimerase